MVVALSPFCALKLIYIYLQAIALLFLTFSFSLSVLLFISFFFFVYKLVQFPLTLQNKTKSTFHPSFTVQKSSCLMKSVLLSTSTYPILSQGKKIWSFKSHHHKLTFSQICRASNTFYHVLKKSGLSTSALMTFVRGINLLWGVSCTL